MNKNKSPDKVLVLTGSLVRSDLISKLMGNGFNVAHIDYCYEVLPILALFKPDVVLIDEVLADDKNAYHQIQTIFDVPVVLIGRKPAKEMWSRVISYPTLLSGKRKYRRHGEKVVKH